LGSGWQVAIIQTTATNSGNIPGSFEFCKAVRSGGRFRRFDGEFAGFSFAVVLCATDRESREVVRNKYRSEERKRAEDAFGKARNGGDPSFENSAIGVAVTDLNARYLATNNVYQTIVGYTEEELRALDFLTVTHEDYRQANWALITELVEGSDDSFRSRKSIAARTAVCLGKQQVSLVPGTERVARS